MTHASIDLSIVVPVYGCASTLDELARRVATSLDAVGVSFELVLVDDASRDNGPEVMARLAGRDSRVRVVSHAVNRGQHAAIAEGISQAQGVMVAVMDCDLQDPPERLADMLVLATDRRAIVVGRRGGQAQNWWRRVGSRAFGAAARRRLGSRLVGTHSVFSVLPRRAVDVLLTRNERTVMYLPILETLGVPIVSFDYDREPRTSGQSSYGFWRLVGRAIRVLRAPPAS